MRKKRVALTGASGNMGFQGFLEFYTHREQFDIAVLLRDSKANRKKFAAYEKDPAVRILWGDMTRYEDMLALVNGEKVRVESVEDPSLYYDMNYLDMAVIPASFGEYRIKN
ncbi:MAG: hypothetical protein J6V25_10310, partial [Oscillospiraceae bacterium]|nr:hypothetical protein [Oscillospiraceae bacterium]